MKDRIEKIRKLVLEQECCRLAWHSPYAKKDPFVNLESTFATVIGTTPKGECKAIRYTGTIEQNEIKHQRILFEGDTLVRIRNGPRSNLVVKPSHLRYEETAVTAGLRKKIEYGREPDKLFHTRDGDIQFLGQLEHFIFSREPVNVSTAPFPDPYKKVRTPDQVQPRITGELVTRLKELGDWGPDESVSEGFYRNYKAFCLQSGGSFLFPLSQTNGKGLTVLDLSGVEDETYLLPMDALDHKTEIFRLDLSKSFTRERGV